jgi:hypothetical protein
VAASTLPVSLGALAFAEYHAPPPDSLPMSVQSLAPPAVVLGRDAGIRARIVDHLPADSATLFIRPIAGGFHRGFALRPAGGYEYAVSVPASALREGPHEFVITVYRGGTPVTFPSGLHAMPWAWDYHGSESWKLDVVDARTPLRLFVPAGDAQRLAFSRIGDAGRRGLFGLTYSGATGQPAFRFELPERASGPEGTDYTASLAVGERVRARAIGLGAADAVHLRLRGLGTRQVLHVTLMEDDGTSWTAAVEVDSTWSERALPLAAFRAGRGVLLPQGFPGEWNYWVGPAEGRGDRGDRLRLERVERLQLSLRREAGVSITGRYGVEMEWVTLGFKEH